MKLLDYVHYEDFGHEWYFQLLSCYPKFALVDLVIQWDEYPATEWFPFLIIGIGPRDIGFTFRWRKFELRFDVLDFEPRNLNNYREGRTVYYKMRNPNIGISQ
jgi:hypothetical protein